MVNIQRIIPYVYRTTLIENNEEELLPNDNIYNFPISSETETTQNTTNIADTYDDSSTTDINDTSDTPLIRMLPILTLQMIL